MSRRGLLALAVAVGVVGPLFWAGWLTACALIILAAR